MERARPAAQASELARDSNENKIARSTIQIENRRVSERERFSIDDFGSASFRCLSRGCCRVKTRFSAGTLRCEFCMWRGIVCLHFIQILTQIQNSKIPKQSLSRNTRRQADRKKKNGTMVGRTVYDVNENAVMMGFSSWWLTVLDCCAHTRWRRKWTKWNEIFFEAGIILYLCLCGRTLAQAKLTTKIRTYLCMGTPTLCRHLFSSLSLSVRLLSFPLHVSSSTFSLSSKSWWWPRLKKLHRHWEKKNWVRRNLFAWSQFFLLLFSRRLRLRYFFVFLILHFTGIPCTAYIWCVVGRTLLELLPLWKYNYGELPSYYTVKYSWI